MEVLLLSVFGLVLAGCGEVSTAENCDSHGILVYEDMACKPTYDAPKSCPSGFACQGIEKSSTTCTVKNKVYNIGQRPITNDTFCQTGCSCGRRGDNMVFNCAILECAVHGPQKPECYWPGNLDQCCPYESCPPYDTTTKCLVDGVEYKYGERFAPADSCYLCRCDKGWRGIPEEPFCRRRPCEVQTRSQDKIQKACAPIYTRDADLKNGIKCCPSNWVCSSGDEVVKGTATSDKICKFGNKEIKVGQELEANWKDVVEIKKVLCKCDVPPLLSCTLVK